MKRFSTIMMGALAALMMFSFTSCEEDEMIALDMEGIWEGESVYGYSYDGKFYEAYDTKVEFVITDRELALGRGYWVDYYRTHPWSSRYDYVANHIKWSVTWGTIYVDLLEEGRRLQIEDYRINGRYFEGYIFDRTYPKTRMHFQLRRVSSPYWYDDWDYYGTGYWSNEVAFDPDETEKAPKSE